MAYEAPTLEELCAEINRLKERYSKNKLKANDARLESILLIERLSKQILHTKNINQRDALIGLLLFVQIKIEYKYGSLSTWLPADRGELNSLLKSILKISHENTMSQQERLIYLARFYEFSQSHLQDDCFVDLHYKNKNAFIKSIDIKLKQTIAAQHKYIEYVLKEAPDYDALVRNIDIAISAYEKEYNNRYSYFKNPERESTLNFSKLVLTSVKQWMDEIKKSQLDEKFLAIQRAYLCNVLNGMMLLAIMPIYKSYNRLPATRSALLRGFLNAFNKKYDDYTHDERIQFLKALLGHLEKTNLNFAAYKNLNYKKICDTINYLVAEEEIDKNTPTYKEVYTSIAINYAAQYGIKLLVTRATTTVVMPNIGAMVVGASTGPLGIISYGVAGALIETQLGKLVQEQIIDRATAMVYEYVLTAIGTYIGQFAAPNIMLAFEVTGDSLSRLLGFYQDLQGFDQGFAKKNEWVKTIHDLPNHLIPEKEKRILEKTKLCCT